MYRYVCMHVCVHVCMSVCNITGDTVLKYIYKYKIILIIIFCCIQLEPQYTDFGSLEPLTNYIFPPDGWYQID